MKFQVEQSSKGSNINKHYIIHIEQKFRKDNTNEVLTLTVSRRTMYEGSN